MSINYASPAAEPPQGGRSPLGGQQVTDAQSAAGARVGAYLSPNPRLPWPICREAVELIARAEGLRLDAYQDVVGVWTIGRGHTGADVRAGLRWSLDYADEVFLQDVTATAQAVSKLLEGCTQTPQAAGAMVSLAYNIGTAAFARSTVLRAHRAGDTAAAARAFQLWNKATINGRKVEVAGLVRRRTQEAALYLSAAAAPTNVSAQAIAPAAEPPQGGRSPLGGTEAERQSIALPAVVGSREAATWKRMTDAQSAAGVSVGAIVPESTAPASPIHQSGALSLISGGLGIAAAASGDVRTLAENLHINLGAVCAAVSLVVGAVVIYWRWRQRREGWA